MSKIHPHVNFLGIQDESIPVPEITEETYAQFIPNWMAPAAWGPFNSMLCDSAAFIKRYHEKTLDLRSKYGNFIMPFVKGCLQSPSTIFFKRLQMPEMKRSGITIGLDVLETKVPVFEVDETGHFVTNNEGDLIPTGEEIDGLVINPVVTNLDWSKINDGTSVEGTQENNGVTSRFYKIMSLPAKYYGSLGNGIGIRLDSPSTVSIDQINIDDYEEQQSYIHSLEIVLKDGNSAPTTWKTFFGGKKVNFTLNPNSYSERLNKDTYLSKVYEDEYQNEEVDVHGPLEEIVMYQQNIDTILTLMQDREKAINNTVPKEPEQKYMFNLFRPFDVQGRPYRTIFMGDSEMNFPEFTHINTHYLVDGDDGEITRENIEAEIKRQFDNFGYAGDNFKDLARFPFSTFIDPGYEKATTKAMKKVLAERSDVDIISATFTADKPALSVSEETSIAIAIRGTFRLIPESITYGTECCRAMIMTGSARTADEEWRKPVPATYELMIKRCKYLGRADGYRTPEFNYYRSPNNIVQYLKNSDLNNTWMDDPVRNKQWNIGITGIHSHGLIKNFIPSYQTIYSVPGSNLIDEFTVFITGVIKRYAFRVWVELVGRTDLDEVQFIAQSNSRIIEMCKDKFGNGVIVKPETYMDKNASTWNTKVHVGTSKAKVANNVTVVTHKLEDLQAAG